MILLMRVEFRQITHVCVHYFKSFSRVKSSQDEVRFVEGNELKSSQVELLSFFYFISVVILIFRKYTHQNN